MKLHYAYKTASLSVLFVLALAALFVPVQTLQSEWIPLISGWGSIEFLNNGVVSVLLGLSTIGATLFSIYMLLRRSSALNYPATIVLFLLLIAATPSFLHFNTVYLLLLALVWVHYCIVEREIFVAFLILSASSLFYAPAVWLVPFSLLLIPFSGSPDSLKSFVKAIAGFLLPHIYVLLFRWMRFDDAEVYLTQFVDCITDLHIMEMRLILPRLFLAIYLFYLVMRASIYILNRSMGKLIQGVLKMQMLSLVISLPLFFAFDTATTALFPIIAYPAAVVVCYYLANYSNTKRSGAELILLLLAIIINALSYFI